MARLEAAQQGLNRDKNMCFSRACYSCVFFFFLTVGERLKKQTSEGGCVRIGWANIDGSGSRHGSSSRRGAAQGQVLLRQRAAQGGDRRPSSVVRRPSSTHVSLVHSLDVHVSLVHSIDVHVSLVHSLDVHVSLVHSLDVHVSLVHSLDVHVSLVHSLLDFRGALTAVIHVGIYARSIRSVGH